MALEAVVFQQDPFSFGCRDAYAVGGGWSYGVFGFEDDKPYSAHAHVDHHHQHQQQQQHQEQLLLHGGNWESSCSSVAVVQRVKAWDSNSSSTDACTGGGDGLVAGSPTIAPPVANSGRRKRRRTRSVKNREQVENQRMTHIAVERNRRRQMNEHLAVLRSLMPASYVQRGDQASIIGGAINFVKELEQLLQPLEAQKRMQQRTQTDDSTVFSDFFTFPQYSTYSYSSSSSRPEMPASMAEKRSAVADVEVTVVETHANIKVLSRARPKQLFKMVAWLHSVRLTILHLNVTTVDQMVLYSFSAKVEDDCVLSSVNEIATAVYEMVGRIQGEAPLP